MANTLRIKRRLTGDAGQPTSLVNAELAFNEVDGILYYGKGGNTAASASVIAIGSEMTAGIAAFLKTPSSANLATAISGETGTAGSLVFSASPSFTGTVQTSGDIYANTATATYGELVATTNYVDEAVSRTTGAGMSLHPVAADCATTGPLTLVSYYDSLAPLISTTVRVAIPQPASAAEGAALYELKGLPIVQTVQLAASDKVLVMGHLDPSMIGLWVIPAGANGTTYWTRETGYETAQGFHFGARVSVANGTYVGQTFAVLADAVYPTKDVAGPSFNSVNFATTSSSVPSGAGILFHKVVRAKADTYTIVNGKVVVDGVTLNQSDRFLWTPQTSTATDGGAASGGYTNVRAGIWRVNYDKVTGGNAFNVITRAGDLNDQADFVNFNTKKILVREGSTNANKIFTAATNAGAFTVAQEITDTAGTVATFGTGTPYTAASSGGGLTGTPIIDGYQTVIENLAATPPVIGSVVLVKNETNPVTNGLYYVKINGAWIRHPSADAAGELVYGSYIRVNNGTVNRNSGFVLTTNLEPITPNTDALSFESPTTLLDFRAGIGLERVGREFRVKAASANITVGSSGIDVASGTTSAAGIVQLEDSTSSTSTAKAATPNSVKSAYDLANTANTTASAALPKAGGTMTGTITLRAGTAAAATAPIYLTSGTNLTAAAAGAVEWNGTNLFITDSTAARKTVAFTDSNITGTAAGLSATLAIGSGGTGQTTAVAAFDALAPTTTTGDLIYFNGTDNVRLAKPSAAAVLFNDTAGAVAWNTVTGTTNVVRSTSPTFETSIVNAAASTPFGVFNGAVATLNAFGNATNVNIASDSNFTTALNINIGNNIPASGQTRTINIGTSGTASSATSIVIGSTPTAGTSTTTLQGAVVVAGNFTVNGATTILNTNTLTVDDKNIEIGSVVAASGLTGTVGSVSGNTATITGLASTGGLIVGMTVTRTAGVSTTLGTAATITGITDTTTITISATSAPATGTVTFNAGTATDVTATGGGITLKGDTDKTIIWNDVTKGWEFNQNVTTSSATVNINGASPSIVTSQTSGTASVFATNITGTVNIGSVANNINIADGATGAGTIAIGTGALVTGTRAINIGQGVAAGVVNVGIGASASGTTTINSPTVNMGQSGSGTTTINSPTIATGMTSGTLAVFNAGLTGTLNIGGAATTVSLGGTSTTSLTLGNAAAASTTNIATGANASGVVKAVNIGTTGLSGSTTNVNIGSGVAGATTSVSVGGTHTAGGVTVNPTTTSTSTTTGALIVAGGVGIAENLNVGGNVTISTGKALNRSLATALTAAGANQAAALALTNDINIVTTTASGTGVVLPTPTVGRVVVVINRGASALNVYPAVAHNINGITNSAVVLAINATMIVRGATITTWFSELTDLTNATTGTLPIGNGGTGATSAANAFNALSPNTTLGDLIYGNGANTNTRLAGNTTTTRQVLAQTGTGSASAAPVWVNQCDIIADCTLDGGSF